MYNLASVFEIVCSPAFSVSMFIWIVAVTFFMSRSAASTSHDVISGISFVSVMVMVLCSLLYCFSLNDFILIMDFSTLLV